jgi:phosphate acyltransferase
MMRMRVAVDAMGGDRAPGAIVEGAVEAAQAPDVAITLVGAGTALEEALERHPDWRRLPIDILDAPDVVGMAEPPLAALRRKRGSSIRRAADLVAGGGAAALVSAGNTGATVMATHAAFGMVPGVDRPALAATIPTRGGPAVLLDAGATVECRPHHLLQFAVMGVAHARLALGIERPRVGTAVDWRGRDQGERADAGDPPAPARRAGALRRQRRGARDLQWRGRRRRVRRLHGQRRAEDERGAGGRGGGAAARGTAGRRSQPVSATCCRVPRLRTFPTPRRLFGVRRAPLLGVAGLAIVAHGRSSPAAVRNAIALAARFAASGFTMRVEQEIAAAAVS